MEHKSRIIIIAICSALSGLLFGYDAGIISGALLFIQNDIHISASEIGWIVAMVPLGALVSSAFSGAIGDWVGRKKALFFTALCFIIGVLICIWTDSATGLIVGRLILGVAIGIGSCISPVYTSELADESQRGWLVNLFVVSIQVGVFCSFLIAYALSHSGNWREMIGIGIIPAILLGFGVFLLPESPRWLIVKNKKDKALAILTRLYGKIKAEEDVAEISSTVAKDKINWLALIEEPRFLKIIFIGAAVSFFTQTVGINAFNYYAPTIFAKTGYSPSQATYYTMYMGLMLVLSTISSLFFIDKIGRKKPLMLGTTGILAILLIITLGFTYIHHMSTIGTLFFACAVVFMAFHGISIGPACFLIPSEVFPTRIRGLGMGISVAFNWGANVIIAAYIPDIIKSYGINYLFGGFFVLTVIAWIVFKYYIPETKGVTLEHIERNVVNNVKARDLGNPAIGD
jgi:SP family galactose:H+ symporter-like MFS transporter